MRFVDTEPDESCRGPRQRDFNRYRPRIAQRAAHRQSRGALGGDDGPVVRRSRTSRRSTSSDSFSGTLRPTATTAHGCALRPSSSVNVSPTCCACTVVHHVRGLRSVSARSGAGPSRSTADANRHLVRRHRLGLEAAAILRRKTPSAVRAERRDSRIRTRGTAATGATGPSVVDDDEDRGVGRKTVQRRRVVLFER